MNPLPNLCGKTLLITGGTGSFGSAVLQRFLNSGVSLIKIFSRDEKKQHDMRMRFNDKAIDFVIGDVRDYSSIHQAMFGVDFVFHAAALKQVPSCEFYPMEAVRTNILGAENVLNASLAHNVERVTVLSTDKAVYPINAMGLSKAMMEKLMISKSRLTSTNRTIFSATRYGNVMASRGSVIPHFIKQIKNNNPITVTDPSMTRFLMSLEESVDLVLYAFSNSSQGDIFVQKSPAATVGDLALALKTIFDSSVPIQTIGSRHGEKLYESLLSREEYSKAEDLGRYFRVSPDSRTLNYETYFDIGQISVNSSSDYTSHNTRRLDLTELINLLLTLSVVKENLNA